MDNRSQYNNNRIVFSGLTDQEGAKQVARKLFDTYDRDMNGVIDNLEVVPMIAEAYKAFNRVYNPTRSDIDSFSKVLDTNGDGRITVQDLEKLCVRYLCGGQYQQQF